LASRCGGACLASTELCVQNLAWSWLKSASRCVAWTSARRRAIALSRTMPRASVTAPESPRPHAC
ncbi:hypothetical protein IW143_001280, partial [Coemansia sp. RSA 520]